MERASETQAAAADDDPTSAGGRRRQLERLNSEMRRLNLLVRTTEAPLDVIARANAELAAVAEQLEPHAFAGPHGQHSLGAGRPGQELFRDPTRLFPYSPVLGALNPISPPARFTVGEDGTVRGEVICGAPYAGPPTGVHGGIVALLMDELLGCVVTSNLVGGFTGTLTVRYRRLTPVGEPLELEGHLTGRDGRKAYASGTIHCDGELTAEAEGVFVQPRVPPGLARVAPGMEEDA